MDLSFLLPSNTKDRDIKSFSSVTIDNINNLYGIKNYKYEILVYSPDEVTGENVRWIKETTFSDGCVAAYNALAKAATGKYLVQSGDDYTFDHNFHTAIDLLESSVYARRRFKMLVLGSDNGLGSFMPAGYPKYTACRYPIIAKETVQNLMNGVMFHPLFKNHYADNWLGYWLTMMFDETIVEVWNTTIHIGPPASYNTHNDYDFGVFRSLVSKLHNERGCTYA